MKRLMWALMASVLWFGCKPSIPSDIIQTDRMEKILYDMHIVDGYLSTIYVVDSAKKVAASYYNGIYKKFDTDSVEYNRSLIYYNNNPKELELMYKNIQKALAKQKKGVDVADAMIKKKKFKADSLVIVKKFKADSISIKKKMKPDSLSKVKAIAEIAKKKKKADSLINLKKSGELVPVPTLAPAPIAVQ
ncbi:DUF4296 domain-containing protein [Pedobacter frigidisoli]|uniref:DUF4296 domain-containing protein n=1 Tax=Pedobacter frigidisoli TaxID=2530455 RepID=A0A4V2MMS3_9SPHI|nr:DUF4296 domain-containing protein [Pedobacter frigidisoli]TCD08416.1 DUF4296 domain-containing protein [Pedobacter frigidisoli]